MLVDYEPAGDGGGADLHAALARHGVSRPVSGRTPFLLDQPERVGLVVAGRIELFLTELRSREPAGTRTHLCTVEAGGVLFGVPAGLSTVGFLAVASVGTTVVDLPRATFEALVEQAPYLSQTVPLIDAWVGSLSEAAARAATRRWARSPSVSPACGAMSRRSTPTSPGSCSARPSSRPRSW